MAPYGRQLFNNNDDPPLPTYTEKLETLLKSKTIAFNDKWWRDLNIQTRNFYVSKDIILSNPNDYRRVCGLIQKKFPKIPVEIFRKKLSQNFQDYRKTLPKRREVDAQQELDERSTTRVNQNLEIYDQQCACPTEERRDANGNQNHTVCPEIEFENFSGVVTITENPDNFFTYGRMSSQTCQKMSTPNTSRLNESRDINCSVSRVYNSSLDPLRISSNTTHQSSLFGEQNEPESYRCQEPQQAETRLDETQNKLVNISNGRSENQCGVIDQLMSCSFINLCSDIHTQNQCIETLNSYFARIKKCEHRPVPTNIRIGSNTFEKFSQMIASFTESVYDHTILSLFEELFSHRTLMLWNTTEECFHKMYSCLNNDQMMDLEVKLVYGNESYEAMKSNLNLLLKAINHLNPNLNIASAVRMFMMKINPLSEYCQIFRDEGRFERFICDSVGPHTLCILVVNEIVMKTAVISTEITLQPKSLFDAIFLNVLMYHVIEKPFPSSRIAEFRFLEQCITGSLDMNKPMDWTTELLNALSEISTIDSSSDYCWGQEAIN
ncbi:unnamed protein product [Allacma fusca]|uniref:Uncharacterized protein n=1 Tax=Allacma fusca TaxID=39272 RepID=A0A8J2LC03_9HEXA|nr:unnamed protein product [Allacma fusca]